MGCHSSKSTTVVEAAQKPGEPVEEEEEHKTTDAETKVDSTPNANDGACERKS